MWNHLREDCRGVKYLERGYIFWLWVWRGNRGLVRRPCLEVNVCNDRRNLLNTSTNPPNSITRPHQIVNHYIMGFCCCCCCCFGFK